ncbi:glycosyl transferase family 2 [Rhodobacter sp. JA431]|uniref:glycosyltransferase family 2 protein n=1 Tax=Rhodobacter sp. JA431 TaxID=570013 RepID=UPI000BD523F3|nr:glycosyltransferase family 2 protein [Rhodobacter sp. JA431]SOC08316.1 glycosyl transferase family 2 [Rhodobacter sp. JA431]
MERASVTIVMATYNGAEMLPMQLQSFAAQSLRPARLLVSDDGSRDQTRDLVHDWAKSHPEIEVTLRDGPKRGAAQNFLSLLRLPVEGDFLSISDQDDIWLEGKLEAAVTALQQIPAETPALYCGRTWEVYGDLNRRRLSRGAPRGPSFAHALVQNIGGGNTMVLNRAGAEALRAAAQVTGEIVVHDWWIYQVITGIGGVVLFDEVPHMLYRQHAGNEIGANRGWRATMMRARALASGRFAAWCACNVMALRQIEPRLTPENRALLNSFDAARRAPPLQSLAAIRRAGLYRQGLRGQLSLYAGALLQRL